LVKAGIYQDALNQLEKSITYLNDLKKVTQSYDTIQMLNVQIDAIDRKMRSIAIIRSESVKVIFGFHKNIENYVNQHNFVQKKKNSMYGMTKPRSDSSSSSSSSSKSNDNLASSTVKYATTKQYHQNQLPDGFVVEIDDDSDDPIVFIQNKSLAHKDLPKAETFKFSKEKAQYFELSSLMSNSPSNPINKINYHDLHKNDNIKQAILDDDQIADDNYDTSPPNTFTVD
jgi:hypothetical protein